MPVHPQLNWSIWPPDGLAPHLYPCQELCELDQTSLVWRWSTRRWEVLETRCGIGRFVRRSCGCRWCEQKFNIIKNIIKKLSKSELVAEHVMNVRRQIRYANIKILWNDSNRQLNQGASGPSTFQMGGHGPFPFLTVLFFSKIHPSRHAVKCLTWWKIEHQITSHKTTFSKMLQLLSGAYPPSDTPLRSGAIALVLICANAPFLTSKIWPPPHSLKIVHCAWWFRSVCLIDSFVFKECIMPITD